MKISLPRLTTTDLATLAQRTIESSENGKYLMVSQHPLLEAVKAEYAEYKMLYSKLSSSGMGHTVNAADDERDDLFAEIRAYLKGIAGLRRAAGKDAAAALLKLFDQYGQGLTKMSYSTETAQLRKLLADLELPENQAHIATLKLQSQMEELKTVQAQFEEIFGQQSEANAELRELPAASRVRKELEGALRSYYDLLEAMKSVPEWKMLYLDISEMVAAAAQSNRPAEESPKPTAPKSGGSNLGFKP